MRSAQKSNRARGRGSRKGNGGGNNINRVYESTGPEGKVRGTAQQIIEKYLSLARDAQTSGDRVNAENFLQHAEHYQRVLSAALGAQQERQAQQQQNQPRDDDDDDDDRAETEAFSERQDEPQAKPIRAEGGGGKPRRDNGHGVAGMQTIDAGVDDEGPELIVTPEEARPPRKRRRSNGGQQQAEAEAGGEQAGDTAAE